MNTRSRDIKDTKNRNRNNKRDTITIKCICVSLCLLLVMVFATSCKKNNDVKSAGITSYLVTDFSGIDDEALNEMAWNAHTRARDELGIDVGYVTVTDKGNYEAELKSLSDNNINCIWGIGQSTGTAFVKAAELNVDTNYICLDASLEEALDNLKFMEFKVEEAAFLAGYFAAKVTKTDTIGFLGAFKDTITDKYLYGYMAGAKHANEQIKINIEYTEDYADKEKGKESARKLFESECNIVFTASGYADLGCIEEADINGAYVITAEYDKSIFNEKVVIASVVKKLDALIFQQLEQYSVDKTFDNANLVEGLSTGIVGFDVSEGNKLLSEDIKQKLQEITNDIIDQTIKVPDTLEKFDELRDKQNIATQ